ncbi:acetolactate synthase large subunit [Mesorhizobium sp. KR2-14]|uniref:acetolactate synthase large subunit n=1 Tax=Mesorhizobium sp. KR2-14 TaxID=3156610 RepID=UPI0032B54629
MTRTGTTNGAERLCDSLLTHGVDVCFANPGTSEMHFVGALDRRPEMRCVLGLFEGVVTGAADGYARMADKPAATLLHLGPGLANGLANLHNAKRARTPMINVVGDHATYHLEFDAPLASDIESLARPMSNWVKRASDPHRLAETAAEAWQASLASPGIATLILPADVAWGEADALPIEKRALPEPRRVDPESIRSIAKEIAKGGRTIFLLGGRALRADKLAMIKAICDKTGAEFVAETFNARIERGRGRVPVAKIPYAIDQAVTYLAGAARIILVEAAAPVAFFAYPDKPSLLYGEDCKILTLAAPGDDLGFALDRLAGEVGAQAVPPIAGDRLETTGPLPTGGLTAENVSHIVAALMPENAIVSDESVTSGRAFYVASAGGSCHDYMQLTGGSIGIGLPLATGAAVACPDRRVVSLQADGSAMYTIQSLWTQARENLDVTTVICSNRAYAILELEMKNVGIEQYGDNARRMFKLDTPTLDWVSLARGHGVEAVRVETCEAFADLLRASFSRKGPFLIEAVI